jgi:hypothetical protein
MLEGVCPQCKVHYHGKALIQERNQVCLKCGSSLEVSNNGIPVRPAYYHVQTEEYRVSEPHEEWEDLCVKNLLLYVTLN